MGQQEQLQVIQVHLNYKLQTPMCTASLRSERSSGTNSVPPEGKMITDNTEYMKAELQRAGCHVKALPSLMAETANSSTVML